MLDLFQHPIIKVATMLSRFATPRTNQMGYRNKRHDGRESLKKQTHHVELVSTPHHKSSHYT